MVKNVIRGCVAAAALVAGVVLAAQQPVSQSADRLIPKDCDRQGVKYCGCLWRAMNGHSSWHDPVGITEKGCDTPALGGFGTKYYYKKGPVASVGSVICAKCGNMKASQHKTSGRSVGVLAGGETATACGSGHGGAVKKGDWNTVADHYIGPKPEAMLKN